MTTKTTVRTVALVGVVSALSVPAVASAHPAVYSQTARVNVAPAGSPASYADEERYVVANHGFTYVLRESNGRGAGSAGTLARGVITYAKAEGKGKTDGFVDSAAARTGVQAHATCEIPAGPKSLSDETTIRSWQGATVEDKGEPFYAYVPFQTGSAGLEDDPAKWLPVVQAKTGVDLRTVGDTDAAREAACEAPAVGGTYYPADATQSTNAAFNSGLIAETKAPLEARIATFEQTLAAAQAKQAATDAQLAAATAKPGLPGATKPLAATLAKKAFTPAQLASSGVPVSITGPAGQRVRVRASVSAAQARRHGLNSTILGSKAGVVGQDGTGSVAVKPSKTQGRKLRSAKGSVPVTLELVVGTTKATVAR